MINSVNQPDALECAAQLDAEYGRQPNLKKLPTYCVAFSLKDVYDTEACTGTMKNWQDQINLASPGNTQDMQPWHRRPISGAS